MIINLTQHDATIDQINDGVMDLPETDKVKVRQLITFDKIPTKIEMEFRAKKIAEIVLKHSQFNHQAMIGGAPYFMPVLDNVLKQYGITPLYAFSERVSEEVQDADGNVKKVMVFKHIGFVTC